MELAKSELFESAFAHAAIGMALVGLDGRWLVVNHAVCRLLGYTEHELFSLTFQALTHPDDLQADLASVDRLLRGEIDNYQMEKRYFRKDGRLVWGLLSVSLARDTDHRPLFFISQIQDITAGKRADSSLVTETGVASGQPSVLPISLAKDSTDSEEILTICPWTRKIRSGQTWVPLEEFLSQRLRLKVSHGMSEEAAEKMINEIHEGDL